MNDSGKSNTMVYHAPSQFILAGLDYSIYVAVEKHDSEESCGLVVRYVCNGEKSSAFMQPYHSFSNGEAAFSIYYTTIPENILSAGNDLEYEVFCNSKSVGTYKTPVIEVSKMPPLIITEIFSRPKGAGITAFVELTNLSDEDIDLYDYKLMARIGKIIDHSLPIKENYFTNKRGEYIVHVGKSAAVFFAYPANHKRKDGYYLTKQGFCETLIAEDFRENFKFPYDNLDIYMAEVSVYDENSEEFVLAPEAFNTLFSTKYSFTYSVAPRDGGYEDGIFEVYLNDIPNDTDTKTRRSSYFKADLRNPKKGVRITTGDFSTPGYLTDEQSIPDPKKAAPIIIMPISPNGFYTADGDFQIKFCVISTSEKVDYADVYIKLQDGSYDTIRAKQNENGEFEAAVDQRIIAQLTELNYYIKVYGSVYTSSLGSVEMPFTVELWDNAGPAVKLYPEKSECLEADYNPLIYGDYFDISGVDTMKCEMYIDKKNVSSKVVWSKIKFKYRVKNELPVGDHCIDLLVYDLKGNRTYIKRTFSISDCKDSEMNFYCGEVHAHTAISDGVFFLSDAMKYARDIGKVDFFSITDHSHYFNDKIYNKQKDIADSFNVPGSFAALYGYEMTWNYSNGYFGHMNIFGSDSLEKDIDNTDLAALYSKLKKDNKAIAMFNHPGYTWGNFDDYALHDEDIDKKVCLAEIKGKGYDIEYMTALAKGWHVSPMYNEDNHTSNWTTASPAVSYAIAPALTRANIYNAFRKRRTYTTSDPTMKVTFKINDEWMGSHLNNPSKLNVYIKIQTKSIDGIGVVRLVGEDNITVATFDTGSLQFFETTLILSSAFEYYYLKITSSDMYTVTSPVWIENRKPLKLENLLVSASNDDNYPHSVSFTVTNNSDTTAHNVCADIYMSTINGFNVNNTLPYESVFIDKLDAGQSYKVMRRLPDNKYHRISIIVSSLCKKIEYLNTQFVLISPVAITEIMPKTSDIEKHPDIKNPFPYIKIHNNTNKEISLDKALLRLWVQSGKQPVPERMQKLDNMKISARGDLVLWVNSSKELTIDDFNEFYGSDYTNEKDFYIVTNHVISGSVKGTRIDIVIDGDVVTRVHYNYGITKDEFKTEENTPIYYEYSPNITATSYPSHKKSEIKHEKLISNYTWEKTLKKEKAKKENSFLKISNETKNKIIGATSTIAAGAVLVAAAVINDKKKTNNKVTKKGKK